MIYANQDDNEINFQTKRSKKQKKLNSKINEDSIMLFQQNIQYDQQDYQGLLIQSVRLLQIQIDEYFDEHEILLIKKEKQENDITQRRAGTSFEENKNNQNSCTAQDLENEESSKSKVDQEISIGSDRDQKFHQFLSIIKENKIWSSKPSEQDPVRHRFLYKSGLIQQITPNEMCHICNEEDFESIKLLGEGSNGRVEKQLFKPLNQEVAKKKYLNQELIEGFDSEVYIMYSKQAEYVPKLIYFNKQQLSLYMELGIMTFEDFDKSIRNHQINLHDNWTAWILAKLFEINYSMYQSEFHHGDIKLSNVVFTFNNQMQPQVKLIDFGGASTFCEDYWIQYTPNFQCQDLISYQTNNDCDGEKGRGQEQDELVLNRKQIFFAEYYSSCRCIQLLTLSLHPQRNFLFRCEQINSYLEDQAILNYFPKTRTALEYIFKKEEKSLDLKDVNFIQASLSGFEQETEEELGKKIEDLCQEQ